jgi:hypothetical protein
MWFERVLGCGGCAFETQVPSDTDAGTVMEERRTDFWLNWFRGSLAHLALEVRCSAQRRERKRTLRSGLPSESGNLLTDDLLRNLIQSTHLCATSVLRLKP